MDSRASGGAAAGASAGGVLGFALVLAAACAAKSAQGEGEGVGMRAGAGVPPRAWTAAVETTAMTRGGSPLSNAGATAWRAGDGGFSRRHGDVTEHLQVTDAGVEQSWRFPERPAGRGDLRLRVRLAGQVYAGETGSGLRFADPATGRGVTYGHATWIDARGERTAIPARHVAGAIELEVPDRVLETSGFPGVLDPIIGEDLGVGTAVVGQDAAGQSAPALAAGAESFLLVWEHRDALGQHRIRGARVDRSGALLDPTGFSVTPEPMPLSPEPRVASGRRSWLVVWQGYKGVGARLIEDPSASLPGGGPPPLPLVDADLRTVLSDGTDARNAPDVAFDGESYLVVWSERTAPGWAARGAWLNEDGALVGAAFDIADTQGRRRPSVACSEAARCLVSWVDQTDTARGVEAALVGPAGVIGDPPTIILSDAGFASSTLRSIVASNSTSYLVGWNGSRANFLALVGADGQVLHRDTRPNTMPTGAGLAFIPQIGNYVYAVNEPEDASSSDPPRPYGMTVSLTANTVNVLSDHKYPVGCPEAVDAALACNATQPLCLAVSQCEDPMSRSLGRVRVDGLRFNLEAPESAPSSSPWPASGLSNWNQQAWPSLAFDPVRNDFLIAWADSMDHKLHVAQIEADADGAELVLDDGDDLPLKLADLFAPTALARGTGSYLAAWYGDCSDDDNCELRAMVARGEQYDSLSYIDLDDRVEPDGLSAVVDKSGYTVLWTKHVDATRSRLVGACIDETGGRCGGMGSAREIAGETRGGSGFDAAFDGARTLAVWVEENELRARYLGNRVSLDGEAFTVASLSDPDTRAPRRIGVAVACDTHGTCLVVWAGGEKVEGILVSPLGDVVGSRLLLAPGVGGEGRALSSPKVVFDGESYLVTYHGYDDDVARVRGVWVDRSGGAPEAASRFEISHPPDRDGRGQAWGPAVASDGKGRSLIAYARSDFAEGDARLDVSRVRAVVVTNRCQVPTSVACTPEGACQEPGACIPDTERCTEARQKPDGALCDGGLCFGGTCVPDAPSGAGFGGGGEPPVEQVSPPDSCGCRLEAREVEAREAGQGPALLAALAGLAALGLAGRRRRQEHDRVLRRRAATPCATRGARGSRTRRRAKDAGPASAVARSQGGSCR